jgi:predicted RNA binding protein YcfA (HicA-like mRNA interferase family)
MPSPVRFAVVRRLLESSGWRLDRISSSHHIFVKPGEPRPFPVPVHKGLVKHGYYRQAEKLAAKE